MCVDLNEYAIGVLNSDDMNKMCHFSLSLVKL